MAQAAKLHASGIDSCPADHASEPERLPVPYAAATIVAASSLLWAGIIYGIAWLFG